MNMIERSSCVGRLPCFEIVPTYLTLIRRHRRITVEYYTHNLALYTK